jgi:hypothetical protein
MESVFPWSPPDHRVGSKQRRSIQRGTPDGCRAFREKGARIMSIGNEIAYRRSRRKDASGSLVFDQERKRVRSGKVDDTGKTAAKKRLIEKFPG